jgi:hypothetical protein
MAKFKLYKTNELDYGQVEVLYFIDEYEDKLDIPERRIYQKVGCSIYDVTDKPGCLGRQMCDRMCETGSTLDCSPLESLIDCIRRELRRWAYDVRKDLNN